MVPPASIGAMLSRFGDDDVDVDVDDDSDDAASGGRTGSSAGRSGQRRDRQPGSGSFLDAVDIASRGPSLQGMSFVA